MSKLGKEEHDFTCQECNRYAKQEHSYLNEKKLVCALCKRKQRVCSACMGTGLIKHEQFLSKPK